MKKTYKIGDKNRIVISVKICKKLKLKKGGELQVFRYGNLIILKKYNKKNKINFLELEDLYKYLKFSNLVKNSKKKGMIINDIPNEIVGLL